MAESRTILVSGAGIAGLTAALSLALRGFRVEVFEKSGKIEAEGAGIQVSPNALRILDEIGVGHQVRLSASAPQGLRILSAWSGWKLNTVPFGAQAIQRFGLPYLNIHRADLHQALFTAANDHPDIEIHLDTAISDHTSHENGVTALASSKGAYTEHRGRLLIGADGIWSSVRKQLDGKAVATHSGHVAWRGMIPAARIPSGWDTDSATLVMGGGSHAVIYPVRNGRYLNVVIVSRAADRNAEVDRSPDPALLEKILRYWNRKFIELVRSTAGWTIWPLFQMPPTSKFASGRIALIGDAAHGMVPFAAQGACMAIEDAHVLARLLAERESIEAALDAFNLERVERVRRVARLARLNGAIYHLPVPFSLARDAVIAMMPPSRLLERQAWIYDWKP